MIQKIIKLKESDKKKEDYLPENCGIKKYGIPKYCYYITATVTRGN